MVHPSKPELSIHFKKISDVEARKKFDPSCAITTKNVVCLIGKYDGDRKASCQYKKVAGLCNHTFYHGWLAKLSNGKEGLIGCDCASKYFKADKNFKKDKNRLLEELDINNSLEQLGHLLADEGKFAERVQIQLERISGLRLSIQNLTKKIPERVVSSLRNMSKTGNSEIYIQIEYTETDDDGQIHSEWVDQRVSSLNGMDIWDYTNIGPVIVGLKKIAKVINQVDLNRSVGRKKLKTWCATLMEIEQYEEKIDVLSNELGSYCSIQNIQSLIFMVTSRRDKEDLARLALMCDGDPNPSNSDARRLIRVVEGALKNEIKSRRFRPTI